MHINECKYAPIVLGLSQPQIVVGAVWCVVAGWQCFLYSLLLLSILFLDNSIQKLCELIIYTEYWLYNPCNVLSMWHVQYRENGWSCLRVKVGSRWFYTDVAIYMNTQVWGLYQVIAVNGYDNMRTYWDWPRLDYSANQNGQYWIYEMSLFLLWTTVYLKLMVNRTNQLSGNTLLNVGHARIIDSCVSWKE